MNTGVHPSNLSEIPSLIPARQSADTSSPPCPSSSSSKLPSMMEHQSSTALEDSQQKVDKNVSEYNCSSDDDFEFKIPARPLRNVKNLKASPSEPRAGSEAPPPSPITGPGSGSFCPAVFGAPSLTQPFQKEKREDGKKMVNVSASDKCDLNPGSFSFGHKSNCASPTITGASAEQFTMPQPPSQESTLSNSKITETSRKPTEDIEKAESALKCQSDKNTPTKTAPALTPKPMACSSRESPMPSVLHQNNEPSNRDSVYKIKTEMPSANSRNTQAECHASIAYQNLLKGIIESIERQHNQEVDLLKEYLQSVDNYVKLFSQEVQKRFNEYQNAKVKRYGDIISEIQTEIQNTGKLRMCIVVSNN
eukprot:Nk52_evm30s358 gene=Nk52_evmTU30s358